MYLFIILQIQYYVQSTVPHVQCTVLHVQFTLYSIRQLYIFNNYLNS